MNYEFRVEHDGGDNWTVYLDGSCDGLDCSNRDITGHAHVPHHEAISALSRFIADAQQALGALRDREETP